MLGRASILAYFALICISSIQDTNAARLPEHMALRSSEYEPHTLMKKHGGEGTECDEKDFRKSMLKLIKEMPLIGLFDDIKNETKFEASGMTIAPYQDKQYDTDEWLWIVFDNLHALGRVDRHFEFASKKNMLVGHKPGEKDSQFEGITYVESTGNFIVMEEVRYHDEHDKLHPFTHELRLTADGTQYETLRVCPVHYELKHENKGFEGVHFQQRGEEGLLMGLCEGNHCWGGKRGRDAGHGRIVVAVSNGKHGEECGWDVLKTVEIPRTAFFTDYSGMAVRGNRIAIVSQENAALWIGTFDFEALEFTDEGRVFNFPRDNHCDIMYCNVEGVSWDRSGSCFRPCMAELSCCACRCNNGD
ncbi:hypothetical protein COO60DRAFT_1562562 [Scenedesmus sp. NREL 46B-D3]|nr:hypothetical protein COO60DRAFT_1562562 [Scenedesmus sp. NREL 46B-D3]